MKCLVLAGGSGNRLWPLSRKNYPKQFIQIQDNHSIFQETIARNIPYCDEFIIVTNKNYEFIIENQIKVFQGISYSYVFEKIEWKTAAAVLLPCMQFPDSETVFVVSADQIVEGSVYKDDIIKAKAAAKQTGLVAFMQDSAQTGLYMFQAGNLLNEIRIHSFSIYNACRMAFKQREYQGSNTFYSERSLLHVPHISFDKIVRDVIINKQVLPFHFQCRDINNLEDLVSAEMKSADEDNQILHRCNNTAVFNQCSSQAVVVNGIDDAVVINTEDAIYVGAKGKSNELKNIIKDNPGMGDYFSSSRIIHRQWGNYKLLTDTPDYLVKKVSISPGKTIYSHKHLYRSEHWSIVNGTAKIVVDEVEQEYHKNDHIDIPVNAFHQVSNIGVNPLIIIEVATGENVHEEDMVSKDMPDLTEADLGMEIEPFVKLAPVYKDYLWGGTRLKDIFGKDCDYDTIAESWELSAHKDGQSIVASGRHKGMLFRDYLNTLGKECLGWKCQSMSEFPILVKFIDAKEDLSVQVHPNDDFALKYENEYGKNEMWYIVDCEEGSGIYCGFKTSVSREEVKRRLENHSILDVLNWIPVQKGDVFFIPAGTVHAIGKGVIVCEIQQNSNSTYRLYDYDRKDRFGNLRDLHVGKALEVLNYNQYEIQEIPKEAIINDTYYKQTLCLCKYFECTYYNINHYIKLMLDNSTFYSIICIYGNGFIKTSEHSLELRKGNSFFVPVDKIELMIEGRCGIIITHI